ncbi:Cyclic nucleotide-gated ion channel 1 [Chlorella sorokiniana]|uniref:Cyclic nucleotide-gated ion channel 1 n=1 Tax=Chlorella sorokiniana TaxID=3076 RepID=A0A2P6TUU7_CHLSO|nr:Cyclic nucleotide-gated ion channel 1 [Chlorella sorokiniana]|eukprot:PRW57842.1 Cyclic nucleotide-gated ion channel 1 [Chlorella sorokiniana]
MNEPSSLASPAQLLQLLQQQGSAREGEGAPAVQELLEGARRLQAGAAPPLAADQVEVFPEPGFVIKTANEQGQKVFINVCGSTKLPLPGGWPKGQIPPEVKQHLEGGLGGDAPAAMRVPLCLGNVRIESDHRGVPCMVADCLVNSEMLERAGEYRPLKIFLIQLALAHTARQVGLELDPQYKLPKMRYKGGTPPPQFIRMHGQGSGSGSSGGGSGGGASPAATRTAAAVAKAAPAGQVGGSGSSTAASSKPLIAEVGSDGEEPPAFALLASKRQARQRQAATQRQQPAGATPQAQQESNAQQEGKAQPVAEQQSGAAVQLQPQIEYVGKPATEVCIRMQLPAAVAAAAQQDPETVATAVCAEMVRLEAPGCAPLEVRLPFAVSAAGGSVKLQAEAAGGGGGSGNGGGKGSGGSGAQLVLRLPYRPFGSVLEELRQAAGAAEGQPGGGGGGSLMDLD